MARPPAVEASPWSIVTGALNGLVKGFGPQKQRDDQGQSPGVNSMTMPPLGGGGMKW